MELLVDRLNWAGGIHPTKIAIRQGDRAITYARLLSHIEYLAGWLVASGLNKGDRVCIHLVNSIEYVCIYYACWRANLIAVPLNTFASRHEIKNWSSHCTASMILSQSLESEDLDIPVFHVHVTEVGICINNKKITRPQSLVPEHNVIADDVASILFTSGSTGDPKGVTLTHRNLSNNTLAIVKALGIKQEDIFLCVLPFFYSFGNSVLHTHLSVGATLVLQNSVMYPVEILKVIEQEKCTGFAGVPSIYISLLKKTGFSNHDLSSLCYMTQAGGPMSVEYVKQIQECLPAVDFLVMYGQTEASARISCLPRGYPESKTGSAGIPVDDVSIRIINECGIKCGAMETGEIYVSGDNVMTGYWDNAEATSKVLQNGWLKTGDLGYQDEDGFLYIVGRQSEILKISEHRVSPYEIEEALLLHPDIEECAVVGCSHEQTGQFAKAFIVKSDPGVSVKQIKWFCKQHLASYKIPREIEFINCLPKTTSGKIRRGLLS